MVNIFMTVLLSFVNKLRSLRHFSERKQYCSGQAAREGKIETGRKWEVAREADIHPQSLLGKPVSTLGFAWHLEKRSLLLLVLSLFGRVRLWVTPWTAAHHGIFQARVLEWGAIAFSKMQSIHLLRTTADNERKAPSQQNL